MSSPVWLKSPVLKSVYLHARVCMSVCVCTGVNASLTVKRAGHGGCVGTKELGCIRLALLLLVCINALWSQPTQHHLINLVHMSVSK